MDLGKETEKVEFKRSTSELEAALCDMAAILNKHGFGILYFGVHDDGRVVGQEIGKETLRDISRRVSERIKPEVYPEIALLEEEGKSYIKVAFSGSYPPYSAAGRYYIRVADSSRELSPLELSRLILGMNQGSYEALPTDEGLDGVDEEALSAFARKAAESGRLPDLHLDKRALLEKLGLLYGGERLTNAGRLLFSKKGPIRAKMAVFAGKEKKTFLDIHPASGNVFSLIGEAEQYVLRHIDWPAEVEGFESKEKPEIPEEALREIIVNCFAHANYLSDSDIEIDVFPDRVAIYNPGSFPEGLFPEDYVKRDLSSKTRNKKICEVLHLSKDLESYGTGFKKAYALCKKEGVRLAYEKEYDGFRFLFLRGKAMAPKKQKIDAPTQKEMGELEAAVLKALAEDPCATREDLAKLVGRSSRQIQRILDRLREEKLLYRVGSRKKGQWVVNA